MKKATLLALTALCALSLTVAAAPAAERVKGPFAGAVKIELQLTKRDGSTATVVVERVKGEHRQKGVFHGVVHADLTVSYRDGSTKAFQFDRGRIASIGGGSVTIERRDGKTVTLDVDSSTIVRDNGETEELDVLAAGERAMFFSQAGKVVLIRCISGEKRS